ncbi:helix-turn-helix transcriptional regulator [Subtercola sp. RTI3]|uniref:helix-turn-helix transcriptional regulator n=1 Tax=Subtercola sp. RTI3 TaxID=3048639 RepID=UPI002B23D1E7|nr:helix-turn-helix transcriptional regulator [Subtercola sp. RTI3]MEA9985507.1 helix-turn-helix transcriptional regulator [Subtercola sp. RTI3]
MAAATRSTWALSGAAALDGTESALTADRPSEFRSRGLKQVYGDVIVCHSLLTPFTMAARADDSVGDQHYVSVVFVHAGHYVLRGPDTELHFEAGSAGYMSGWTRVAADNLATSRVTRVSVRREQLSAAGITVAGEFGAFEQPLSMQAPTLSFVMALLRSPAVDDDDSATPIETVLTQLIIGMFSESRRISLNSEQFQLSLRTRAISLIYNQSSDPSLTPAGVAAQLNVSLRHLQRCFTGTNQTISETIRARRLQVALAELAANPLRSISMSEIARQAGFSSMKEFRYAVKTRSGVTPRELRAAGATPARMQQG